MNRRHCHAPAPLSVCVWHTQVTLQGPLYIALLTTKTWSEETKRLIKFQNPELRDHISTRPDQGSSFVD